MKSPPVQYPDDVAQQMVEDFIAGSRPASNGNGSGNGRPAAVASLREGA